MKVGTTAMRTVLQWKYALGLGLLALAATIAVITLNLPNLMAPQFGGLPCALFF